MIDRQTAALGLVAAAAYVAAAAGELMDLDPAWVSVPVAALASTALMIVLHEATHRNASERAWVNGVIGRLAMPFVAPYCSLPTFRYLHGQHHNHTNALTDPDRFVTDGRAIGMPFRWLLYDLAYVIWYVRRLRARPLAEVVESTVLALVFDAVVVWLVTSGHLRELLLVWLLPQRLAFCLIAWGFAWLPHHGLPPGKRAQTTRARLGLEWLLTPALFAQNFHLVHHLYPRVPFHRLQSTWRGREAEIRAQGPPLVAARLPWKARARDDRSAMSGGDT